MSTFDVGIPTKRRGSTDYLKTEESQVCRQCCATCIFLLVLSLQTLDNSLTLFPFCSDTFNSIQMLLRLHVSFDCALFLGNYFMTSTAVQLSTDALQMLTRKLFNPVPNRRFAVGILVLATRFIPLPTIDYNLSLSGNRRFCRFC